MRHIFKITTALALAAGLSLPAAAQDEEHDEIVVTASKIRVTQGGAQDIEFFKESIDNGYLPAPAAITSEGFLSEYDLPIAGSEACDQLFCLVSETARTTFISDAKSDHLVGLGFATNLTYESWERDPLTIIAVVDKSGSMGGEPLDLAKASMQEVLKNLRAGDKMGVVQYGSTVDVVVPVTDVASLRRKISDGIDSIESGGSTYMEAGLELAYATAFKAQKGFDGTARVVLFTDEQPNVGETDSESFIGMARDASKKGVGLTTIGVAEHFGADLANKLSAARGGNLFYVTDEADVTATFGGDFDLMMTEVAHDLEIKIKPVKGARIETVYGVPGEVIEYDRKGGAKLVVPSLFLSSNAGGIFLGVSTEGALKGEGKGEMGGHLADISMSYVDARDNKTSRDRLSVKGARDRVSPALKRAAVLVDAFEVIKDGTRDHFFGSDLAQAISRTETLLDRLEAMDPDPAAQEAEFISDFLDILEEARDEQENADDEESWVDEDMAHFAPVSGKWQVTSVRRVSASAYPGAVNIRKGDLVAFHLDDDRYDETEMFNLHRKSARRGEPEFEVESFGIDVRKKQIKLYESGIDFDYSVRNGKMRLYPEGTDLVLTLTRI